MRKKITEKILHKSVIWYGGGFWHRVCQSIAEIVALEKGYRTVDTSAYRTKMDYQPDLIVEKMDKFISGPRRFNKKIRYAVEIVDSHAPGKEQFDEAIKQGFDDILLIRKIDLKNPDSIEEIADLCRRVIP